MSNGETDPPMESPFCEHLNTNQVPTDGEIERIRAHLTPHEEELANRVNTYIAAHRALIPHPRRLPQNLVEEIFLGCLPTHRNAAMSAAEAPLLLGRICSAWRSVACQEFGLPLTSPCLWALVFPVKPIWLPLSIGWSSPHHFPWHFQYWAAGQTSLTSTVYSMPSFDLPPAVARFVFFA
ncbi:hypothetical protein DFH08DRAFT_773456 [Mycena albidolilacea]|uniref:F-box domain-containing protein n=1 Tax=Mycena albidolilacea TaxID=1033008 RepID=A0AAD7ABD6_9AGAR|nr:hypothetical protein DFH08DRAFT_773456 [Mycena albidolilacea]